MSEKMLDFFPQNRSQNVEINKSSTLSNAEIAEGDCVSDSLYIINVVASDQAPSRSTVSDHGITASIWGVEVFSKKSSHHLSTPGEKENILIRLLKDRLKSLGATGPDCAMLERIDVLPDRSNAIFFSHKIGPHVLNNDFICDDFLNSLSLRYGIQIHRNYQKVEIRPLRKRGGLAPRVWAKVKEYISSNLSISLTLEKLADVASLSPSHFSKAFKETTGVSPHQYIMNRRLLTAKDLINENTSQLREIAFLTGFASQSHLTVAMKKAWGVTPKQLRRELKQWASQDY